MSAHDDITRLLHLYAESVDLGELGRLDELFAHATYRTEGVGDVLTGEQVSRVMSETIRMYDGRPRTKHLVTNAIIELEPGGDQATSRSYFTVLQDPPGRPPAIVISGRYHDSFELAAGQWRFTDRLIHIDQVGDLSHHLHLDRLGW